MARAATSKTRAVEKSKPITSQTPVTTTQEIVAGKFNEADWNNMLEKDGNEEFVAEIVDDLIQLTMDAIYKKYIDRQLLPFTITQARDAILEIIQWQFLARDEGERTVRSNPGWLEDAEPEPAETDCWAQGSMPKSIIVVEPEPLQKILEIPEEEGPSEVSLPWMEVVPQEPVELADTVSDAEETQLKSLKLATEDMAEPDSRHQEVKFDKGSRKMSVRKRSKPTGDHEIKRQSEENKEAADKLETPQKNPTTCSSYIKTLLVRPIGTKDAVYDEFGNVLAVTKLDPEKLPTHKVNVKFTIADPTKDSELKVEMKKKNQSSVKHKARVIQSPSDTPNKAIQSKVSQMAYDKSPSKLATTPKVSIVPGAEEDFPLRRSMIEEIEVSQGIIVRENGRTKKGPGRYYRKLDILEEGIKGMKPVNLRIINPGITVADLLDRQSPILHAFGDTPPLPPIVRHPSQQTKQMS